MRTGLLCIKCFSIARIYEFSNGLYSTHIQRNTKAIPGTIELILYAPDLIGANFDRMYLYTLVYILHFIILAIR